LRRRESRMRSLSWSAFGTRCEDRPFRRKMVEEPSGVRLGSSRPYPFPFLKKNSPGLAVMEETFSTIELNAGQMVEDVSFCHGRSRCIFTEGREGQ